MSKSVNPTVLFVDDNLDTLQSFSRLLKSQHLNVVSATDLPTALARIKDTHFDALLCDIHFNRANTNDWSAVQVATFANRVDPGIPIIASTAFFTPATFSDYEKSLFSKVYAKAEASSDDMVARVSELRNLALNRRASVERTKRPLKSSGEFDVFLCHNSADKPTVRRLANLLIRRRLRPWYDEWELIRGRPWQEALEDTIAQIRSAAILIGKTDIGPWADREMRAFLSEFVRRKVAVIPVMLPGAPDTPDLPVFLREFTWVDLRRGLRAKGIDRLVWGITGVKP